MTSFQLIHTTIFLSALCLSITFATPPSDQLLPPAPPPNRRLPPPPPPVYRKVAVEPPGIMTRIARWFGFNDGPSEQQVQASYYQPQFKDAPFLNFRQKPPCNLCNRDPWVPVFPGSLQYPLLRTEHQAHPQIKFSHHPNNNNFDTAAQYISITSQRPPVVARFPPYASNYNLPPAFKPISSGNFLPPQSLQSFSRPSVPVPIPNLSQTPIPPLYDFVPFRDSFRNNYHLQPIESGTPFPPRHGIHPSQIPPNLNSGNNDASIEIIKSVPLTEFVASVEYPIDVIQSPIVDLTAISPRPPVSSTISPPPAVQTEQPYKISPPPVIENSYGTPSPPQPTQSPILEQPTVTAFETSLPPQGHFDSQISPQTLNDNSHNIPRLTELGSYSPSLVPPQGSYFASPITAYTEADSHAAASSHNVTFRNENNLDVGNFVSESQGFYETTTRESPNSLSGSPFTTPEPPTTIPSIVPFEPNLLKKGRETPKHLLDSPIYYTQGSSPRPFTRDPSQIQFRNSEIDHPNSLWQSSPTATPWAFVPTSTPIYLPLGVSHSYADTSDPSLYQSTPKPFEFQLNERVKQPKQIVIPYTIDNKATPFKVRLELQDQSGDDERYVQWANSHDIELHEQQESKVVTATQSPGPSAKSSKYLTKILAANIRDLLRREHELKNKSKSAFDITKLQKNIDDWTEQEFTSLTHRGSTVSVRGRSKNIPSEYLTTTPSLTQQRTGSVSSTQSPPTTRSYRRLLDNEELKKYEALTKLVDDNGIEIFDRAPQFEASTTTEDPQISPFYVRTVAPSSAPHELWNRLKVAISPQTKEKVYVVTPQPEQNHRLQSPTTSSHVGSFKSPRFLVRPTPGVSQLNKSNSTSPNIFTPELFGLMGVSAYSPPSPVETFDGHSKVITIVTPSGFNKKRSADAKSIPSTTTQVPSTNQQKSS